MDDQIVALPPLSHYFNRCSVLEKEVDQRFTNYYAGKDFSYWQESKSDHEIEEEFLDLSALRGQIWFDLSAPEVERGWREDFQPAFEMVREDFVRNPNCTAFDYNKVSS